jgi:hypothetical protein
VKFDLLGVKFDLLGVKLAPGDEDPLIVPPVEHRTVERRGEHSPRGQVYLRKGEHPPRGQVHLWGELKLKKGWPKLFPVNRLVDKKEEYLKKGLEEDDKRSGSFQST